jgi:hypothetical protein
MCSYNLQSRKEEGVDVDSCLRSQHKDTTVWNTVYFDPGSVQNKAFMAMIDNDATKCKIV